MTCTSAPATTTADNNNDDTVLCDIYRLKFETQCELLDKALTEFKDNGSAELVAYILENFSTACHFRGRTICDRAAKLAHRFRKQYITVAA